MNYLLLLEGCGEYYCTVVGTFTSIEEAKEAAESRTDETLEWTERYPDHPEDMPWFAEVDDGEGWYTIREI